ncbi:MAG: uroporphyrinogen decarboxylase family protein [Candidatus Thorarchaeota archaeon]
MISRERVMTTLNRTQPDKVPIDIGDYVTGIHMIAYRKLIDYLGIKDKNLRYSNFPGQTADACEELLERFESDTRWLRLDHQKYPYGYKPEIVGKFQGIWDQFGVFWGIDADKELDEILYYDNAINPLSEMTTVQQVREYDWPDGTDKSLFVGLRKRAKQLRENTPYAVVTSPFIGNLFEYTTWLFGFSKALRHLLRKPEMIIAAMEELEKYWLDYTATYFNEVKFGDEHYVDVVTLQGDLGTQSGPIMNVEKTYVQMIKPLEMRLAQKIHKMADVKINYHCCGSIPQFIPHFTEIGYDAINPVQVQAYDMEPCSLKQRFGSDVTFWGGICDTQNTLPFGTPEQIRKEVKYNMNCLKPNGGFVAASIHNITAEVPPENIVAMFDAVLEFRDY